MAWAWVAWVGDMLQKIFSDLSCPLARAPWPLEPLPTVVTVITNTKITHTHTDGWMGGWMDGYTRSIRVHAYMDAGVGKTGKNLSDI